MCGVDFIHGSKVPTDVLDSGATAANVAKFGVGCLVVAAVIVLLVWLLR
jgi:hypothetical protein